MENDIMWVCITIFGVLAGSASIILISYCILKLKMSTKNNGKIAYEYDQNNIFVFALSAKEICNKIYDDDGNIIMDFNTLYLGSSSYSPKVDLTDINNISKVFHIVYTEMEGETGRYLDMEQYGDESYPEIRMLQFNILFCRYSNISYVMKTDRIGNCIIIAIMGNENKRKFKIMYKIDNHLKDSDMAPQDIDEYIDNLFHIIYNDILDINILKIINYPTFSHNADHPTISNRESLIQFSKDMLGTTLKEIIKNKYDYDY